MMASLRLPLTSKSKRSAIRTVASNFVCFAAQQGGHGWVVFLVGVEVLYEPDELLAQAAAPLSPLTDAQSDLGLGHAAFRQGWCWGHGSESGRPEENATTSRPSWEMLRAFTERGPQQDSASHDKLWLRPYHN
jgi:hypothetical protein